MAKRPEVLDDFIRNFLIKMKLEKTLESFQAEWYELTQKGILTEEDVGVVPDIYLRNQQMDDNVKYLRTELDKARKIAEHAESMFDNLRKERDFHRMHHKRVVQERTSWSRTSAASGTTTAILSLHWRRPRKSTSGSCGRSRCSSWTVTSSGPR